MKTVNIEELPAGDALDWLVSVAEGYTPLTGANGRPCLRAPGQHGPVYDATGKDWYSRPPTWSRHWVWCGQFMERGFDVLYLRPHEHGRGDWCEYGCGKKSDTGQIETFAYGETAIVAICRAVAAQHHGWTAEVPAALLGVAG